jgi:tetratricopeptide (TPR) repeat protein
MTMRFTRSVLMFVVAVAMGASARPGAQESPRTLFESGNFQAVLDQTPDDSPVEALYLKALAYLKLSQNDPAKDVFRRLGGGGDSWRLTGESAIAQVDGNLDAALSSAQAAVAADAGMWAAQYQLGLVLEARGDIPAAAEAFVRAAQANPQMAYAHYNAGMNFYKAQRVDQMAVYFENFLKLAPNAPERPAVESVMRTIRGR